MHRIIKFANRISEIIKDDFNSVRRTKEGKRFNVTVYVVNNLYQLGEAQSLRT